MPDAGDIRLAFTSLTQYGPFDATRYRGCIHAAALAAGYAPSVALQRVWFFILGFAIGIFTSHLLF